jgi:hypothetical protein
VDRSSRIAVLAKIAENSRRPREQLRAIDTLNKMTGEYLATEAKAIREELELAGSDRGALLLRVEGLRERIIEQMRLAGEDAPKR